MAYSYPLTMVRDAVIGANGQLSSYAYAGMKGLLQYLKLDADSFDLHHCVVLKNELRESESTSVSLTESAFFQSCRAASYSVNDKMGRTAIL